MNNSDQRLVSRPNNPSSPASLESADIVIVGNGIAGLTAAVEARRLDPDKRIVIITDQNHPTINTPALKQFAIAKLTREQLLAYPAGTERTERIHIVNSKVEEIHAQSKYVSLSGKRGFGYGSLLIATGSYAMGLPANIPGRNFDGVLTLHRLQDYLDLRRRIGEVNEAVVVGGGVHAIETVMGLLHWGIHVHWLIRGTTFMKGMLDEPSSEMVLNSIRRGGATVHLETEVVGIVGRVGSVAGIITNQQEMIPCQLVLSCTGTKAAKSLADHCTVPMKHDNGILVDDKLRTSVRDIYAAGDVAALRNPQTNKYEPRAQWYAARTQGRIAGAMMVGHDELALQPFGVYWHATHVGELSMLTVGEPLSKDRNLVTLTDNSQGSYRRVTIMGDRLVGYLSLGTTPPDSLAIKRIVDEGHSIRDVIKPLLKGQFDARDYISRQRSRATQTLLTQKLPPLLQERTQSGPVTRRLTEDLTPRRQTDPLRATRNDDYQQAPVRRDDYQQVPARYDNYQQAPTRRDDYQQAQSVARAHPEPTLAYEDEINPFTGNLPSLRASRDARDVNSRPQPENFTDEINPFTGNLPSLRASRDARDVDSRPQPENFTDEINPFTGNLPGIAPQREPDRRSTSYEKSGQSNKLLPPRQEKRQSQKLWAFIDQN